MICINLPARRRGFALVIVLSAVVLMTILLLAYFSRAQLNRQISFGSAGMARAEMLANTATDMVVGDLVKEMELGSIIKTTSGTTIFLPSTNASILPSRSLPPSVTSLSHPNLIKISKSDIDFAEGVHLTFSPPATKFPSRAVDVSTLIPSTNGRFIGLSRWDETRLSQNNFTVDMAPDWVLITRSGLLNTPASPPPISELINRSPANTNRVIGRFAYAIYDMGGLLNANVAGYPSTLAVTDLDSKPNTASADLTALGLTQVQVDAFVTWRNAASASTRDSYLAYSRTNAPTNGFLTPATGDRGFFSRQDLIGYATTNAWSANALTMLTAWKRDSTVPNWTPDYDATSLGGNAAFNYRSLAQSRTDIANPTISAVRRAYENSIDGESAKVGDAVVRKPFPLTRLAWLGVNGPAGGANATQIRKAFGLVWDATAKRWIYTSPDSTDSTPAPASLPAPLGEIPTVQTIKTLGQVAALDPSRDPDFFEYLKAGLLRGSLGKVGRQTAAAGSGLTETYVADVYPDYQIFRIGAGMIDQADEDSIPTEIRTTILSGLGSIEKSAYGTESIPYLARILFSFYRPDVAGRTRIGAWIIPEVWNPHRDADAAPPAGASEDIYPTTFRIVPIGGALQFRYDMRTIMNALVAPITTFRACNPVTDYVEYTRGATGRFRDPTLLTPAFATAAPGGDGVQVTGSGDKPLSGFVGIVAGNIVTQPDARISGVVSDNYTNNHFIEVSAVRPTLQLQVRDSSGTWRPYFEWNGLTRSASSAGVPGTLRLPPVSLVPEPPLATTRQQAMNSNANRSVVTTGHMLVTDPRTTRFSASNVNYHRMFVGYLDQSPEDPNRREAYHDTTNVNNVPVGKQVFQWWGTSGSASILSSIAGRVSYGAGVPGTPGWSVSRGTYTMAENQPADAGPPFLAFNQSMPGNNQTRYMDVDGVLRPADYYLTMNSVANLYANPAIPYEIQPMDPNTGVLGTPVAVSFSKADAHPVVLNRPFLSVAETGNTFRDMPWKTLDLFTERSADSGILALFSVSDSAANGISAARISPNTPHPAVLTSLLRGSLLNPKSTDTSRVDSDLAKALANAIVAATSTKPVMSASGLVADLAVPLGTAFSADTQVWKQQREVVGRSLADVSSTGTWNLLIDLVVQAGSFPSNATSLDTFRVEGERRYWFNIAIDRSTGKIISSDPELVLE